MPAQHIMFVCTTCASVWKDGKRVGTSGGEELFEKLQELHSDWQLASEFQMQPVECMSACSRSCVVSFSSPGKYTYLFGDIPSEISPESVSNILECASKYYDHPQGLLPWQDRPEPLKKGILARIPAIAHQTPNLTTQSENIAPV
ncbi:DUF1636 domain-containing protein [Calothrix sp. 336/3]|uniref:DUF1636 domain-containing protein n=1 Tax=Calothrix sp. 336/3 TaxID=1337936 RepID=UPI0004E3F75A|nr:DUF1636 domain-containing protein [Calothrix sp. 336/3]AKG23763.1 FeS-binding protein [Calothrix sp. 336/3]